MSGNTSNASGDTVKVGLLHSLSGTMAISETSVRDAEKLAIQEINDQGGVMGKKIEIIEEDGASDPQIFSESIFPSAFQKAAMEGYKEAQQSYSSMFEDRAKFNAIMSALGAMLYSEFRNSK